MTVIQACSKYSVDAIHTFGAHSEKPRRLAANARVECLWVEDANAEWYPGLVGQSPTSDEGYSVLFDDEDERWDVPRRELRAVYTKGALDWVSPWRDDHGELVDGLPPQSLLRYEDNVATNLVEVENGLEGQPADSSETDA